MTDVLGRESCPDDIGEKTRHVDKYPRRKALIMRERQKTDAGSDACAENPYSTEPPREQPIRCAPCIHNRLAHGSYRPADIGGNEVFRSFQMCGPAMVMVRQ